MLGEEKVTGLIDIFPTETGTGGAHNAMLEEETDRISASNISLQEINNCDSALDIVLQEEVGTVWGVSTVTQEPDTALFHDKLFNEQTDKFTASGKPISDT